MVKKTLSLILILVLIISTLGLVGCSNTDKQAETGPIKIGAAAPMTGDYAMYGEYAKDGIELAKEEINKNGGILGRQIEIVYADDKGDSKEAVNVAQKFVSDSSITAILGHFFSGCTLAAGPIYQQNGIPEIAIASTNPNVADIGDYVYRINVGDNYQGAQMAKWLFDNKKYKKVAVIYDNSDYGKGVSTVFSDSFKKLGGEVTASESYIGGQEKDFSVILTKIKAASPEAIVLATYQEGALIIQQAKKAGLDVPFIGSDSIYTDDFIQLGGSSVEGTHVVCYFHPTDPRPAAQEFVKKYKEKYDKEVNSWSPYAYDALNLLADAIKRAGSTDKAAIKKAISETSKFEGATGETSFTNSREPIGKDLVILVVKDGKFVAEQ
ncbi:MAG: hypothetical protein APF77_07030 [Clostridia bacterium BRH_c25]|nr:MAG: hypothetical protein APF77_07030 [Clostridia bacterium BRH_c25]